MLKIKSLNDINKLIADQVQESVHLDYKASDAVDRDSNKRNEISKDVSAFANSDGGTIIYGVIEQGSFPISIDNGVDHKRFSREWIEQVINSNVFPKIEGLKITQISVSAERSIFVVNIPKSYRGPHQAPDKKYYKRYNFQSVPMENYEIDDVRSRTTQVVPLLSFDAILPYHNAVHLEVSNIGDFPAMDVKFKFDPPLTWHDDKYYPKLFANGSRFIAPGKKLAFFYYTYVEIINNDALPKSFDVQVTYKHPAISQRITDKFHIDFMDFYSSLLVQTDIQENTEAIKKGMDEIKSGLSKIAGHLDDISSIAGATGLHFSLKTLMNLRHILAEEENFEKFNPYVANTSVFREVLDVDWAIGYRLVNFFRDGDNNKRLSEIEGIDDEIINRIYTYFAVPDHIR